MAKVWSVKTGETRKPLRVFQADAADRTRRVCSKRPRRARGRGVRNGAHLGYGHETRRQAHTAGRIRSRLRPRPVDHQHGLQSRRPARVHDHARRQTPALGCCHPKVREARQGGERRQCRLQPGQRTPRHDASGRKRPTVGRSPRGAGRRSERPERPEGVTGAEETSLRRQLQPRRPARRRHERRRRDGIRGEAERRSTSSHTRCGVRRDTRPTSVPEATLCWL